MIFLRPLEIYQCNRIEILKNNFNSFFFSFILYSSLLLQDTEEFDQGIKRVIIIDKKK